MLEAELDDGSHLTLSTGRYRTPSGRSLQRDYSNGDRYAYFNPETRPNKESLQEHRPTAKTDLGRVIYGGQGIDPDVVIKSVTFTAARARARQKLNMPFFAFALELAAGRAKGFEAYRLDAPTNFRHDVTPSDLPVSDALLGAFKAYATDKYGVSTALIDAERDFISRELRYELVLGAYGPRTALQVIDLTDNQIQAAIEQLPQAKRLFEARQKLRTAPRSNTPRRK
jgi:carboxyl-terminal processing protease